MRFAHLLPFGVWAHHCCILGACNLARSRQLCLWHGHLRCTRERGPQYLIRKLDSEDGREQSRRRRHGDPLCEWERPVESTELLNWELHSYESIFVRGGGSVSFSTPKKKLSSREFAYLNPLTFPRYLHCFPRLCSYLS